MGGSTRLDTFEAEARGGSYKRSDKKDEKKVCVDGVRQQWNLDEETAKFALWRSNRMPPTAGALPWI